MMEISITLDGETENITKMKVVDVEYDESWVHIVFANKTELVINRDIVKSIAAKEI